MDFESIRKLINNDVYRKTLTTIAGQSGHIIDSREDSTILNIGIQNIRASSLNEAHFYFILDNHNELFTKFSLARMEAFKDVDIEEEYPEGEEPDEDDEDEEDYEYDNEPTLLVISPIGFMIEFHYLLAKDDKGLAQYFKKLRLPKAAKHIQEIKAIFQSAQ